MAIVVLNPALEFPDPRSANPDGLIGVGGDFSIPRLLLAYRSGIFPWTAKPITWWSPDPRAIFELVDFHIPRSLAKAIRKTPFQVTIDRAFRDVIEHCATPAPGRRDTWISPEFIEAYTRLHKAGHAHSIECWKKGELVGGIYGVAIGGFFAGESMFHRASNASKIALCHLVAHLRERKFTLFDIQMITPLTRRLGAIEISREVYLKRLEAATLQPCAF